MNGLELVKYVRAGQGFDSVTVLMVASEVDPLEVTEAMHAGAMNMLVSPSSGKFCGQKSKVSAGARLLHEGA
jgi:PleD family two-component response regulator